MDEKKLRKDSKDDKDSLERSRKQFNTNSLRNARSSGFNTIKLLKILQEDAEGKIIKIGQLFCHLIPLLHKLIQCFDGDILQAFNLIYKMKTYCIKDQINPLTADTPAERQERCERLFTIVSKKEIDRAYVFTPTLPEKCDFVDELAQKAFLATTVRCINEEARDKVLFAHDQFSLADFLSRSDHDIQEHLIDYHFPGKSKIPLSEKSAFEEFVQVLLAGSSPYIISNDFFIKDTWMHYTLSSTKQSMILIVELFRVINDDWQYAMTIKPDGELAQEAKIKEISQQVESEMAKVRLWFEEDQAFRSFRECYDQRGKSRKKEKGEYLSLEGIIDYIPSLNMFIEMWKKQITRLKKAQPTLIDDSKQEGMQTFLTLSDNATDTIMSVMNTLRNMLVDKEGYQACHQFLRDDSNLDIAKRKGTLTRSKDDSASHSTPKQHRLSRIGKHPQLEAIVSTKTASDVKEGANPVNPDISGPEPMLPKKNPRFKQLTKLTSFETPVGSPGHSPMSPRKKGSHTRSNSVQPNLSTTAPIGKVLLRAPDSPTHSPRADADDSPRTPVSMRRSFGAQIGEGNRSPRTDGSTQTSSPSTVIETLNLLKF